MRASGWVLVMAVGGLLGLACERPAEDPAGYGEPIGYDQYGNPIYGQPGQPAPYPQQPYPQQYPPGQPTTSQPSGFALPCQSDMTCGTHKCNLQVGRCAFPCQNAAADCAAGLACMGGFCVPGGGAPPPAPPPQ